ncbi:MAG TPA: FAD-dependent oxidoreductase, partial [Polyangia bacterium]
MAKAAVLICQGCDIASSLDLGALEKIAGKCEGVVRACSVACLCDEAGAKAINETLALGAEALVIAACATRFHARSFAREGCHTERVNLRELVVYSHEPKHEDTQMLAEDMVRMGAARALQVDVPKPQPLPVERTVLVVGGGPSGLAAALGAARAGYQVVLVEKRAQLGGWLCTWKRTLPSRAPHRDLEVNDLPQLVRAIEEHPRIQIYCNARLNSVSGQPGQFQVELQVGEQTVPKKAGAIVQATGWKPYDASRLPHLGVGRSPDVLTNVEFEHALAAGVMKRPSDGKPAHKIAFIQCAGSRDPAHLAYCSNVCCRVSLKQALWARELDPTCDTYVLAKEIRTLGLHEDFYRRAQEDPGIFITKGEVTEVEPTASSLLIRMAHSQLGDNIELEVDLVVLATGMVPVSADGPAIRELKDARKGLARGDGNTAVLQATIDRLSAHEGTEILGLTYRQGPDLPS